jgi:hypothetical protein
LAKICELFLASPQENRYDDSGSSSACSQQK